MAMECAHTQARAAIDHAGPAVVDALKRTSAPKLNHDPRAKFGEQCPKCENVFN